MINNKIVRYINIKENWYFLKIADFSILLLNLKNLYLLLVIDQDEDNDFEADIKYYFILDLYIKKELKDLKLQYYRFNYLDY